MSDSENQRMRSLLSRSPAITYTGQVDEPFCLTYISDNFTSRFGHNTEDCLNAPGFWRENVHPDDCDCVFADYASLLRKGHHVHEYRFRKKNGHYVWILDEIHLVRDDNGLPVEVIGSWIDITERKEVESSLLQSEKLFRDFFQINPVATIISSLSGVVHMVNPAFVSRTGFIAEDVIGRNVQELGFWRIPEDRERMVTAIREFGFVNNLESSFTGKNGSLMICLISSRSVNLAKETMILNTVVDITEQRKAEEALRQLDQAKRDFISTAAHELRTPLIAIVGYSELLENAANVNLSEDQKAGYLSIIQDNAEILNRLVDDLLDVGRIQIGSSLGVVIKENSLSSLIEKVVKSFQVKCQRHQVVVEHSNPLPPIISFDGGRISQVLYNLLSNAVKYSPYGDVVHVTTQTGEDGVSVSITDKGIGMTAEQIERIFDRFYRADFANDEASGLGLGMSIVKQIIDDHHGEIFVTSTPGRGTTVTFTLPLNSN